MLITFSGLDGAGKSTQIAFVRGELARRGLPSQVLHMNDHVGLYAYLRMLRTRFGAASPNPAPSEWARVRAAARPAGASPAGRMRRVLVTLRNRIIWSRTLRTMLYPVDLVIFLAYRAWVEVLCGRVLIMDRYFYDTLVDVSDGRRWRIVRLLERITPAPDLAVYLDIDPETAFARKGEYSVEYLRRRRERYDVVFGGLATHVSLPVRELATTQQQLRQVLVRQLAHS